MSERPRPHAHSRQKSDLSLKPNALVANTSHATLNIFSKSSEDFLGASDLHEVNKKLKLAHLRSCLEPLSLGKLDLIPELKSVQKMMKAITDQVDKIHPLNDHEY